MSRYRKNSALSARSDTFMLKKYITKKFPVASHVPFFTCDLLLHAKLDICIYSSHEIFCKHSIYRSCAFEKFAIRALIGRNTHPFYHKRRWWLTVIKAHELTRHTY